MEIINFYKVNEPYGNFSNFAPFPIFLNKKIWPTSEHFFQANKFADPTIQEKIRLIKSPFEAATEGRNKEYTLLPDWENQKESIMLKCLMAKFCQHTLLKEELLLTRDLKIVEHTSNDSYWGDAGDGSGLNRLGFLLMTVRESINKISDIPNIVLPPWLAFPGIDAEDMFWRMGLGEDYFYKWVNYFNNANQGQYKQKFKAPEGWENFYDE